MAMLIERTGGGGGSSPAITTYSTPGTHTWTKPAGITMVQVWIVNGGRGGRGGGYTYSSVTGAAGASGNGDWFEFLAADLPASVTVTVGAGGAGGAGGTGDEGAYGSFGGVSSFGDAVPYSSTANNGTTTQYYLAPNQIIQTSAYDAFTWRKLGAIGANGETGQNGSAGAAPGGGGGGGGGSSNASTAGGAGGDGADGVVMVLTW